MKLLINEEAKLRKYKERSMRSEVGNQRSKVGGWGFDSLTY